MKIIVGISSLHTEDSVKRFVEAGVDEFFFGYIPEIWSQNYGWEVSCNRREHSNYHYYTPAQVENIVKLIHSSGRKAFMTLNAHEYNNDQIKLILKILNEIKHIPIDAFIISNFALMLELRKAGIKTPINLSIGAGGNSYEAIDFYLKKIDNIGRVVLPRKLTIEEIGIISARCREKDIKVEAFGLADPCLFNDEYCFTWHGASNQSLCNSPMYKHKYAVPLIFEPNWKSAIASTHVSHFYQKKMQAEQKIEKLRKQLSPEKPIPPYSEWEVSRLDILALIGKCGICAFQKFKEFGIDSVKLPLRGYSSEAAIASVIELVKKVIDEPNANPQFCKKIMNSPNFCAGRNCFYNYPYSN